MQAQAPGNLQVSLDLIDWDERGFAIHGFAPHERLEASLLRCGILFPPLLWEKDEGRYVIVDGFKRLVWARERGWKEVQCLVYPKETDPQRLLLFRIEGKLTGPTLNSAEKAQIISKLVEFIPNVELVSAYLPALGISARTDAPRKWRLLATSDETLLRAVASEEICDKAALELVSWEGENDAGREAVALLLDLRCSASLQKEILDRVTEIARERGCGRIDLLRDPAFKSVASDPMRNHRERTQAVRDFLRRLHFPRLKAREDRFQRSVEAATLPSGVSIAPPPSFEGVGWRLQIAFSSPEELAARLKDAGDFAVSEPLREIMERSIG